MAHADKIKDADAFFEVDPITRHIINRTPTKIILMQNDHNSERFTFSLPRFVEGHDMLESARAKLHYMNPSHPEVNGMYPMNDLAIDPEDTEKVKCSWLISGNVTKESGAISFLIEFECYEGDVLVYSWHTQPHKGISIGETFDKEEEIAIRYADILAQWEQRLFSANDEGVVSITTAKNAAINQIIAKGEETKATIPEDYATIDENLKYISKAAANALKGTATGNPLVLTDVSPITHEMTVTEPVGGMDVARAGKNWLPLERELSFPNDNSYTINCLIPAPFTLSLRLVIDAFTLPKATFLKLVYDDGTEEPLTFNAWDIAGSGTYKKNKTINNGKVLTQLVFLNWTNMTGRACEVQVELGSNATAYEPYDRVDWYFSDNELLKIPSLYPTTVICSLNGGNAVTAEYNRDINKAFSELQNALLSLGGNV